MNDNQEVDWGNDEDDPNMSRAYSTPVDISYATGGGEVDDVKDTVSLGGDEEEEYFAAYSAHPNEQNTSSGDKIFSKRMLEDAVLLSVSPKKETRQVPPVPLPLSPQPEVNQLTNQLQS
jgi:hypothetical protein